MSLSHILILGVILIIFVPADKLPEVMRNIARVINDLRRSTAGVWDDLKKEAEYQPPQNLPAKNEMQNQTTIAEPPGTAVMAATYSAPEPFENQAAAANLNTEDKKNESNS